MKFGVFCPRSESESLGFAPDHLDLLLRAEEQGYNSAWLGDCVGGTRGVSGPLFAPAANLTARTEKIRIGVSLGLATGLHPLRLAEEIAFLDVMSEGRIDWAAAWPDSALALENFTREDGRSREEIAIAVQAWTHGRIGWEGETYTFSEVDCIPPTVQKPPPTFVLSADLEVLHWGMDAGYASMWPPLAPFPMFGAEASGIALRHVYVGSSHRKAREEAHSSLESAGRRAGLQDKEMASKSFFDNRALVGDALYCRERIAEWREGTALDSLILYQDFGALSADRLFESQVRFVEEVAPVFA